MLLVIFGRLMYGFIGWLYVRPLRIRLITRAAVLIYLERYILVALSSCSESIIFIMLLWSNLICPGYRILARALDCWRLSAFAIFLFLFLFAHRFLRLLRRHHMRIRIIIEVRLKLLQLCVLPNLFFISHLRERRED